MSRRVRRLNNCCGPTSDRTNITAPISASSRAQLDCSSLSSRVSHFYLRCTGEMPNAARKQTSLAIFLQYPFGALIRKHCEPHETASLSEPNSIIGITDVAKEENVRLRIGRNKVRWEFQREEGSTVPALAPRFLSRHTTSPLLLSVLRTIASASTIIITVDSHWNTVIAVNCLLALWTLCRVADKQVANNARSADEIL